MDKSWKHGRPYVEPFELIVQLLHRLLSKSVEAESVKDRRLCRAVDVKVGRFYVQKIETASSSMHKLAVRMRFLQLFTLLLTLV